jgi:phytoene synthase
MRTGSSLTRSSFWHSCNLLPESVQNAFSFPNIATPQGSSAYYLVRFSPSRLRERQAVLFAWRRELQRLRNSSDPGVARIKLDYWRNELQPEKLGESRHPLTQMIGKHLQDQTGQMIEYANIVERDILAGQSRDWDQVLERCEALGGTFASLLLSPYPVSKEEKSRARRIGLIDEATRQLQRIGRREYQQRFPSLENGDPGQRIATWIETLQELAGVAASELPPGPAAAQLAIASALLDTFRQDPVLLTGASIDITPIRKLWLVWRNRSMMRQ